MIVSSCCFDLYAGGKRQAQDEIEKQLSAKKQKINEVAQKQKEAKVQKKESSSDDSSSESEDEVLHKYIHG